MVTRSGFYQNWWRIWVGYEGQEYSAMNGWGQTPAAKDVVLLMELQLFL